MTIYQIPYELKKFDTKNWDLEDEILKGFNKIENYEDVVTKTKLKSEYLKDLRIEYILNFFDSLSNHWLKNPRIIF